MVLSRLQFSVWTCLPNILQEVPVRCRPVEDQSFIIERRSVLWTFCKQNLQSFSQRSSWRPTEHVDHPDLPGMTDVSWSWEEMILKNNQISSLGFWSLTQNFTSKTWLQCWKLEKWQRLLFWFCIQSRHSVSFLLTGHSSLTNSFLPPSTLVQLAKPFQSRIFFSSWDSLRGGSYSSCSTTLSLPTFSSGNSLRSRKRTVRQIEQFNKKSSDINLTTVYWLLKDSSQPSWRSFHLVLFPVPLLWSTKQCLSGWVWVCRHHLFLCSGLHSLETVLSVKSFEFYWH